MATTKRARYKFVVKEAGIEKTSELREGVIDLTTTPVNFIVAEPCDKKQVFEYPLEGADFLSFELMEGTSFDEAQRIADFLNDHLEQVAITRFGDAEDATRDVRQSERVQRIDLERFAAVVEVLREKLKANDLAGASEATKAVESVIRDLITDWSKAVNMSREILAAFGRGEGPDA